MLEFASMASGLMNGMMSDAPTSVTSGISGNVNFGDVIIKGSKVQTAKAPPANDYYTAQQLASGATNIVAGAPAQVIAAGASAAAAQKERILYIAGIGLAGAGLILLLRR